MADYPDNVAAEAKQYGVGPDMIAAELASFPGATITSGRRTPERNAAVGGVPDSSHLSGNALDIVMKDPAAMEQAAKSFKAPGFSATYEGPGSAHSTGPHIHLARQAAGRAAATMKPVPQDAPPPDVNDQSSAITGASGQSIADIMKAADHNPDVIAAGKEADAAMKANDELIAQIRGSIPETEKVLERLKGMKSPDLPSLEKPPTEKVPEIRDPTQALGQFLPLLALLGGALNKNYAMGALTAATSAMNAQKAGDYEKRDQAHQEWLDNMKRTAEGNATMLNEYDAAVKKLDVDQKLAENELHAIAAKNGDLQMISALHSGNMEMVLNKMKAHTEALKPIAEILKATMMYGGVQLTPDGLDYAAAVYNTKGTLPNTGYGPAGAAAKQRIINRAAELAGHGGGGAQGANNALATQAMVKGTQASITDLTKKQGNMDVAINTADTVVKRIREIMAKGGPPFIPAFNSWIQSGRKKGGNPDVALFDERLTTFRTEYAKVMSGSTGSVAQVAAHNMNEVDQILAGNLSQAQLEALLPSMQEDMRNRKAEQAKEIEEKTNYLRNIQVGQPPPVPPETQSAKLGTKEFPFPMPTTPRGLVEGEWFNSSKGPVHYIGMKDGKPTFSTE